MSNSALSLILATMSLSAMVLCGVALYVLLVIGYWKVFKKAGEPGWKSIIPFYNTYTQYKLTWNVGFFWLFLILSLVGNYTSFSNLGAGALGTGSTTITGIASFCAAILHIIACYKLAKAFGKGIGWTLGLIFLTPFFIMGLGFGSSIYQGPQK